MTPSSDDIAVIENFVISLYSVSCTMTDVNQARQQIFAQSSQTFEYLSNHDIGRNLWGGLTSSNQHKSKMATGHIGMVVYVLPSWYRCLNYGIQGRRVGI